jgi:hypothetical protein
MRASNASLTRLHQESRLYDRPRAAAAAPSLRTRRIYVPHGLAAASNARLAVVYRGRPPRLRIANWWRSTTISSSRSPPPRASTPTTQQRSRYSTHVSTTRSLNRLDRDQQHAAPTGIEFLYPTPTFRLRKPVHTSAALDSLDLERGL